MALALAHKIIRPIAPLFETPPELFSLNRNYFSQLKGLHAHGIYDYGPPRGRTPGKFFHKQI